MITIIYFTVNFVLRNTYNIVFSIGLEAIYIQRIRLVIAIMTY